MVSVALLRFLFAVLLFLFNAGEARANEIRQISFPFCQAAALEPGVPAFQELEVIQFRGALRRRLSVNYAAVLSLDPNPNTRRARLSLRPFDPQIVREDRPLVLNPDGIQNYDLSFDELRNGFDAVGKVELFTIVEEMPTALHAVENLDFYQNLHSLRPGTLLLIRGTYYVIDIGPVLLSRHAIPATYWTSLSEYTQRPSSGMRALPQARSLVFSAAGTARLDGTPLVGSIYIIGDLELDGLGTVTSTANLQPARNLNTNSFRAEIRAIRTY